MSGQTQIPNSAPQQTPQPLQAPSVVINNSVVQQKRSNGLGVAGLVIALIGAIFCWVPVLGFVLWLLGAIFSTIAVFKKPYGLAIAGYVISFIVTILFATVLGAVLSAIHAGWIAMFAWVILAILTVVLVLGIVHANSAVKH